MKKISFLIFFPIITLFISFKIENFNPPKASSKLNMDEVYGIDISHFQGIINWDQVSNSDKIIFNRRAKNNTSERVEKKSRVEFCFIKATEGKDFVDKKFKENLSGCNKYNIPKTGYHYFRFKSDPKKQAQNFINQVPKSEINLSPAIDLEYKGNESLKESNLIKNPSIKKDFVRKLKILSDELETHYGQKPIFYTTPQFYVSLIKNNFPDNPIWISDLRPVKSPNCEWMFWQTSFRGQIKGINGSVDINKFNGRNEDFNKFVNLK
jgi:lysozyme